jgi:protein-tyrosine-phosphatase
MKEFDVDISQCRSKSIDEIDPGSFDTIIFLCAEEACPIHYGDVPKRSWAVADPAATVGSDEHILHAFRETRDRIYMKVMNLQKELRAASGQ